MKRAIAMFLALLLLAQPLWGPVSAAEATEPIESETQETEETVVLISTAAELDAMRNDLDGHYRLACDIDMTGMYTFDPIGNELDGPFTGSLDGAGYTIRNLELSYDSYKYVGLFGCLDGTVEDLVLEDVSVEASRYGGALAGYADINSTIRNITVRGSVSAGNSYFADYAGGVVGYSKVDLANCTNYATVTGTDAAGGIAGVVEGDITNCRNYGTVSATSSAGGIAQQATGVVENCHNSGDINGGASGYAMAGIVAEGASLISDCTNSGDMNAPGSPSTSGATVYGIGRADTIRDCSATGSITASRGICGIGKADNYERCYTTGHFTNTGGVYGWTYGIGDGAYAADCYSVFTTDSPDYTHLINDGDAIGCMGVYFGDSAYGFGPETGNICYQYNNLGGYLIKAYTLEEIVRKFDNLNYGEHWIRDADWSSGLPKPANLPEHLELSEMMVVLKNGQTAQLKARIGDTEVDVTDLTWTSGDTEVVSVTDGHLIGVGDDGEQTYITARTADGLQMSCLVFISDGLPNSVKINESKQNLRVGQTFQFTANVDPLATQGKEITWSSSDKSVTTVDQNGLVTAHAYGTVTIKATTASGLTASHTVYVKYAQSFSVPEDLVIVGEDQDVYVPITLRPVGAMDGISCATTNSNYIYADHSSGKDYVTVHGNDYSSGSNAYQTITLTTSGGLTAQLNALVVSHSIPSSVYVNIGCTKQLSLTKYPTEFDQTITWSSADETIATVDQNGVVTGVRPGAVKITAVSEYGVTRTCTVTVTNYANELHPEQTSICMVKGATHQLRAAMVPADTTSTLSYSTSSTSVVTVSATGLLTARGTGSAIITVKASGSDITATVSVTVVASEVPATDLAISHTALSMDPGETARLTAVAFPENTTQSAVTWTSSDITVATVSPDGLVTAVSSGTTEITASLANGITRTCVVGVRSQELLEITAGTVIASPGEVIEVPFTLVQNPGVAAMRLKICYDSALLTPQTLTAGSILGSAALSGSVDADGTYYVLWSCPQDLTATGTMFTLTFAVAEDAALDTAAALEISFEPGDVLNEDHVELRAIMNNGTVAIQERLGGDVYEDGVLNSHDILLLQQYLTELVTFTNHQKLLADLDLDGTVAMPDLVLLAQQLTNPSVSAIAPLTIQPMQVQDDFTVTAGTAKLGQDGTVTLPVTFSGCPGISAFKFHIGYDDALYALEAVTGGTDEITASLMTNLETAGDAVVTWYSSQNRDLEGQVLLLTFRLRDGAEAKSADVTLSCGGSDICDADLNRIPVELVSGGIRVPVTVASGWSGATQWTLTDDGVLTVYGTGNMKNYAYNGGQPWLNKGVDITSVVIEEGITSVGSGAFRNLTTLESVSLPGTLTKMGEAAFYGSGLESVEIPASLWTIQPYTFKNCANLTSVTFHEGNLQKISDGAFYGTGLTELVLPDCLDILDVYAFKGCANLTEITIGSGLTELREAVFYGTAIPTITVPEGITKIGPYAFKNCVALETIDLPESLTSVGEASFYACTALKTVELPDAVTAIGNYAFRKCAAITELTFGAQLTSIGECAFYGCTGLTEIVIPDKVTTIKPYAFKTCTGLSSVTLGSKVATIGEGAFNTCTGLKTIVFPASVTAIGDYCFSGSYNLWQLTFAGDAPAIGTGAFKGLNATAYYPGDNATWTADTMQNYGGKITWTAR